MGDAATAAGKRTGRLAGRAAAWRADRSGKFDQRHRWVDAEHTDAGGKSAVDSADDKPGPVGPAQLLNPQGKPGWQRLAGPAKRRGWRNRDLHAAAPRGR